MVGTRICRCPLEEYLGLILTSPLGPPETMRLNALVVEIPRWCMASEARNSRIEERKTARPSAPLQKGVWPAPLS